MKNAASLDRARELVAEDLSLVNELMKEALQSRAAALNHASRHLQSSGGKKIRAALCLLAGRATGVKIDQVVVAACSAEMIHAASLCHDDVLDCGTLRRGRPTVRVVFGDAMSILLGDFCLTRAMRLLAERGMAEQAVSLADAVVDMAEGEVAQAQEVSDARIEVEHYLEVAAGKTGSLLSWCATLGGLVPDPHRQRLWDFGYRLGRVYQIADDLLDFESENCSGKKSGQDLLGNGLTMPLLVAFELRPDLRDQLEELRDSQAGVEAVNGFIAEVKRSGALDRAREAALEEAARALDVIRALPPSPYQEALGDLARFAADRHV